jgi:hypothetical protein
MTTASGTAVVRVPQNRNLLARTGRADAALSCSTIRPQAQKWPSELSGIVFAESSVLLLFA